MRGISHEGWAWAWTHGFKQPAEPLLRDEPPTCFFSLSCPPLASVRVFLLLLEFPTVPARCVPFR